MNLALGLRQIFSYLLPGATSIFVFCVAMSTSYPSLFGVESSERGKVLANAGKALVGSLGNEPVVGSLVFVMLSIAVGLVSSSWFCVTLQLVLRCCGDPRIESLSKLPADLQVIIGSPAEGDGGPAEGDDSLVKISLFYDFWSMVKLKVENQLEYSMFSVYALNFCSKVLGAVVLSMAIVLFNLLLSLLQGLDNTAELRVGSLVVLVLLVVAILLFWCMAYFFRAFCYFGMSMFTAVYELDLTPDQRRRLQGHVVALVDRVSDTSSLWGGSLAPPRDPYRWRC